MAAGFLVRRRKKPACLLAGAALLLAAGAVAAAGIDVASGGRSGRSYRVCASPTNCWVRKISEIKGLAVLFSEISELN